MWLPEAFRAAHCSYSSRLLPPAIGRPGHLTRPGTASTSRTLAARQAALLHADKINWHSTQSPLPVLFPGLILLELRIFFLFLLLSLLRRKKQKHSTLHQTAGSSESLLSDPLGTLPLTSYSRPSGSSPLVFIRVPTTKCLSRLALRVHWRLLVVKWTCIFDSTLVLRYVSILIFDFFFNFFICVFCELVVHWSERGSNSVLQHLLFCVKRFSIR